MGHIKNPYTIHYKTKEKNKKLPAEQSLEVVTLEDSVKKQSSREKILAKVETQRLCSVIFWVLNQKR